MTVSQIAGELDFTPQAIYHHIRKMKKHGLVDVSREERVGHFIETYYRSAAEIFQFSLGEGMTTCANEERVREAVECLQRLGIISKVPEKDEMSKIIGMMDRMARTRGGNKYLERIAAMDDADIFVKETMMEFAEMVALTDDQLKAQLTMRRELRALLRGCCGTKKRKAKG